MGIIFYPIQGKYNTVEGESYEGDWENDQANGKGTSIHPNGTKYIGDVRNQY